MFAAPKAPEPPHTAYWQNQYPPYQFMSLPDGLPGAWGYVQVSSATYLRAQVALATATGLGLPVIPTPPRAPSLSSAGAGEIPRVRRQRTAREPRAPRVARDPRPPRRPSRWRVHREPRARRDPRPKRKRRDPRPPRDQRTPRLPRTPATKGDEMDCYCGYNKLTGQNGQFGSPTGVPKGSAPPPSAPGTGQIQRECGVVCGGGICMGPFAPVLQGLFDLLPKQWRQVIDPQAVEEAKAAIDKRRAKFPPRSAFKRRLWSDPPTINKSYCCICGAEGSCFTTGGDCRQWPVLQRSKGQC